MVKLKPGDRVDCRVKDAIIVSPYRDCDETRTFEIIAIDKYGYYLYVPPYLHIKGSTKADKYQCQQLDIDHKFLGVDVIYIQEDMIYHISAVLDGMKCARCSEFYQMSEPNQPDGTLICWRCRTYPHYK